MNLCFMGRLESNLCLGTGYYEHHLYSSLLDSVPGSGHMSNICSLPHDTSMIVKNNRDNLSRARCGG